MRNVMIATDMLDPLAEELCSYMMPVNQCHLMLQSESELQ